MCASTVPLRSAPLLGSVQEEKVERVKHFGCLTLTNNGASP